MKHHQKAALLALLLSFAGLRPALAQDPQPTGVKPNILLIVDTSGSMGTVKKYLARSFYFLLYQFVRQKYQNVEVVFIAHHKNMKRLAFHVTLTCIQDQCPTRAVSCEPGTGG